MKKILNSIVVPLLALLLAAVVPFGQASAQERVAFRQAELDQMLAPVALYPDALLSQVLMASTYPLEVVQASRWSRANPGATGQAAVRAVEQMDWDPSVKSLTAFPQVLAMMNENIEWTERLGEAFLAQQEDVMNSVQALRRRAEAAGNLRSGEQMRVARQGEAISIEPAAPEIVYVPYYDPTVVYGPWWWPTHRPVYWGPPRGYYARPAYGPGFYWGSGIVISAGFFFGHFDWTHRHVYVAHAHRAHHDGRPTYGHSAWRHDPVHRRGVPFRNSDARERFERSRMTDARRDTDRHDAARIAGRDGGSRTADIRQRRVEERRNPPQGRREDGRDDRRESAASRIVQNNDGNRATNRNDERTRSVAQPETRGAQADRGIRPGRAAPQTGEHRQERRDAPSSQAPSAKPQPVAVVPAVRTQPRLAAPAAASTHAAPRQAFNGGGRAETRAMPQQHNAVRERAPAPRATSNPAPRPAAAPVRVPRMESPQQRGNPGARPQGSGNPRGERSANRDSNRGS